MNRSNSRFLLGLVAAAVALGIGVVAFNMGVAQGMTQSAQALTPPPGTAYVYVWPRPWGFGFGFLFPLFFFAFWLLVVRNLFWRRGWGSYRGGEVPPAFEEWHRRAHARSSGEPSTEARE